MRLHSTVMAIVAIGALVGGVATSGGAHASTRSASGIEQSMMARTGFVHASPAHGRAATYRPQQPRSLACLSQTWSDGFDDTYDDNLDHVTDVAIDADSYSIRYNCGNHAWVVGASSHTGINAAGIGALELDVNRDLDQQTGCNGYDEYMVWGPGHFAELVDMPDCTTAHWTHHVNAIATTATAKGVYLLIPDRAMRSAQFEWRMYLHSSDFTVHDAMPDGPRVVTTRPSSTCQPLRASSNNDFNGDGKSDTTVFRPSNGKWYVRNIATTAWGTNGDQPAAADYDCDGKTDTAVFRPSNGTWYVRGIATVAWGHSGDVAVPGDYDGDGRTDLAVFRPSNGKWYVKDIATTSWGQSGDIPVAGDYNGDGRTDLAVFRPSNGKWYVKDIATTSWGQSGDIPVAGDYNGDGRTDLTVFRPSTGKWYVKDVATTSWGQSGDIPVAGDYNGDGRTDLTVFRPSTGKWYVRGIATTSWGQSGDIPV